MSEGVVMQRAWVVVMTVVLVVTASVAVPLHDTKIQNKESYEGQSGVDEEVRQLLDLKSLPAQRDLGPLKSQRKADKDGVVAVANNNVAASAAAASAAAASAAAASAAATAAAVEASARPQEVMSEGESLHESTSVVDPHQEPGHLPHTHHQNPLVRYTPLDLALYVYKTGDEDGVTLAIQELIVQGLMTAEDALSYLQDIRDYLHYFNQQDDHHDKDSQSDFKIMSKKNRKPISLTEMNVGYPEGMLTPELDYESIAGKLKNEDYMLTEYSLEEIIYQLAKILFKQAMHGDGDFGSEKALQGVVTLLEKETARGAITPEVEKKVLDVMASSLVDSFSEKEFQAALGSMAGESYFKPSSESSLALGRSSVTSGSSFKPSSGMFQLSLATKKREAPDDKKTVTEKKD